MSNNNLCTALRNASINAPQTPAGNSQAANFLSFSRAPCLINAPVDGSYEGDRDESEWSGTAVLSFDFTPDVMGYASYSRGYKAGGYNLDRGGMDAPGRLAAVTLANGTTGTRLLPNDPAAPLGIAGNGIAETQDLEFDAETVDAYELGFKWTRPQFMLNVAAFYQNYSGFQLNTFNGIRFEVVNIFGCSEELAGSNTDLNDATGSCNGNLASGVTSKGVEIEALMRPHRDLTFGAALTYADTRFENDIVGKGGRPLTSQLFQLPGEPLPNAPLTVVTGSANWTPPVGGSGMTGLLYADFRYQSEINTGSDLDREKLQQAFITVNARIGLSGRDRRWSVELWAQNLFDVQYTQSVFDLPAQGSGSYNAVARGLSPTANQLFGSFPADPRTYGLTLRGRF